MGSKKGQQVLISYKFTTINACLEANLGKCEDLPNKAVKSTVTRISAFSKMPFYVDYFSFLTIATHV